MTERGGVGRMRKMGMEVFDKPEIAAFYDSCMVRGGVAGPSQIMVGRLPAPWVRGQTNGHTAPRIRVRCTLGSFVRPFKGGSTTENPPPHVSTYTARRRLATDSSRIGPRIDRGSWSHSARPPVRSQKQHFGTVLMLIYEGQCTVRRYIHFCDTVAMSSGNNFENTGAAEQMVIFYEMRKTRNPVTDAQNQLDVLL
jgi:hypothetical protein